MRTFFIIIFKLLLDRKYRRKNKMKVIELIETNLTKSNTSLEIIKDMARIQV